MTDEEQEMAVRSPGKLDLKRNKTHELAERGPFKTGFSHAVKSGYHFFVNIFLIFCC
jgi:hypothetical protein